MKTSALAFLGMLLALTGAASATEPPANFAIHDTPQPVPEVSFQDGNGQPRTLADFAGKVVLLNVWATWCAPCRKEMPTLDHLQVELGGPDFEIVALSVDRKGPGAVTKFFQEIGIKNLALNIDTSSKAMFTLGAFGLPLTLLIDRKGREVGRVVGPAEWDSPEMVAFIRDRIAAK